METNGLILERTPQVKSCEKNSYYENNLPYVEALLGGIPDGFDTRPAMCVLQDANADIDLVSAALEELQTAYYGLTQSF